VSREEANLGMKVIDLEASIATDLQIQRFIMASDLQTLGIL
jgi:hypothetical protein